jgi:hypothetical protein
MWGVGRIVVTWSRPSGGLLWILQFTFKFRKKRFLYFWGVTSSQKDLSPFSKLVSSLIVTWAADPSLRLFTLLVSREEYKLWNFSHFHLTSVVSAWMPSLLRGFPRHVTSIMRFYWKSRQLCSSFWNTLGENAIYQDCWPKRYHSFKKSKVCWWISNILWHVALNWPF